MQLKLVYSTPNMLQLVEMAGRTCYRSEAKISTDSASGFVTRIVNRGHESVIEHAHVVFSIEGGDAETLLHILRSNRFLTCIPAGDIYYLAGNIRMFKDLIRALYQDSNLNENVSEFVRLLFEQLYQLPAAFFADFVAAGWMKSDSFRVVPTTGKITPEVICRSSSGQVVELLHLDPPNAVARQLPLREQESLAAGTVRIKTSRDSSLQEVRHRPAAYSQESQRYVDLQDRLEFIHPAEIPENQVFSVNLHEVPAFGRSRTENNPSGNGEVSLSFSDMISLTKSCYVALRQAGYKPEVARAILPNAAATTMVVTRTIAYWRHYLTLRGAAAAQRPIRERAHAILASFQQHGWLNDLEI